MPDELLNSLFLKQNPQGAKPWLSGSGKVRLMLLKHYTGLSDEMLVERLNTDFAYQLFCQLALEPGEFIRDRSLVTRVRKELSTKSWGEWQLIFQRYWKGEIDSQELKTLLMDATCYESYIRYPTDVKLLWECNEWIHERLVKLCQVLSIKRPRNKFLEQQRKYLAYAHRKKKTYALSQQRRRSLLYLLKKMLTQLQDIFNKYAINAMGSAFYERLKVVKTIVQQQTHLFHQPASSLPDRIVSLYKPYIRPIVRGKEVKTVEFGAKVHLTCSAGLAWIEHLDYKPFNECKRLKKSVLKHEKVFAKVALLGADNIYPTNENRKYITKKGIQTNFLKKGGKASEQEKQAQTLIHNARASQMEGVFGNQKNHYLLGKIKARSQPTEDIWILFGVLTANAVKLANKAA